MNLSDQFIHYVYELSQKEIPDPVLRKGRLALLDYLSVTVAGAKSIQKKVDELKVMMPVTNEDITIIGIGSTTCLQEAIFLNGLCSHALDMDDGTNYGIIHLGAPVFSALLPLAQLYKIDYLQLLKAAIIGYETSFTLATMMQPKHKELGFHATGTCGTVGAAMAIASMLNFNNEQLKNVLGVACVSASGMLSVLDDDSELKPYNVAKAALMGFLSVQMVKAGFVAHSDPLGSERGFFKMMSGEIPVRIQDFIMDGLYAIERTYTKPYAACRYCHPAIEAAIHFHQENICVDQISEIFIYTYCWAIKNHDHTKVKNMASAKMSIPYGVAVGLLYGKAGLAEYTEDYLYNPEIQSLMNKITIVSNDKFTEQFPNLTPAEMEINISTGEKLKYRVDLPKGEPENPMTEQEFHQRTMELFAYGGIQESTAMKIIQQTKNAEGSIVSLFQYL